LVAEITRGRMAHCAVLTTALAESALIAGMVSLVGKRGRVIVTAIAPAGQVSVDLSLQELTFWEKTIAGTLYGSANPRYDLPNLLRLYRCGELKLEELITHRYRLDDINVGYADMREGRSLRGVLIMDSDT
jgi:Zn-dependent alcohol dehydrogenase